jgi:hypothetical protein
VIIVATPRPGDEVAYLVPFVCSPIPLLLAERWPSVWSILSVGSFAVVLGLAWMLLRRRMPVALLSLVSPVLLVGSLALLGSRLIALIWCGVTAAAWAIVLLLQMRGPGAGASAMVWLLRLWLVANVLLGGGVAAFGVMTGLCC